MKCETCKKEYSPDCDYKQGRCPNHAPIIKLEGKYSMWKWITEHIYECNWFVAGWCGYSAMDNLVRGAFLLAALNVALVYLNIKLANNYKE